MMLIPGVRFKAVQNLWKSNPVPEPVALQIFLHIIPSQVDAVHFSMVCKTCWNVKFYVNDLWNDCRRTQVINRLYSKIILSQQKMLIAAYQNNPLMDYSATQFIHKWLIDLPKIDHIRNVCCLIGRSSQEPLTLSNFVIDLLKKQEIEAAFALSECQDDDTVSCLIQDFLINRFGLKKAFELTLSYHNPQSQSFAYHAFIKEAIRKSPSITLADPLITTLQSCPKLPIPLLHAILEMLVAAMHCPVNGLRLNYSTERKSACNTLFKNPLVLTLLKLIPNEYEFHSSMDSSSYSNPINAILVDIYEAFIYIHCESFIPDPEKKGMNRNELLHFITIIEAIPHASLKKYVCANILDVFYSNNNADMTYFWPFLYLIEKRFELNKLYPKFYLDRATEALIIQLADNSLASLIDEIEKPKFKNFPKAFQDLLYSNPVWLNTLNIPQGELAELYRVILKIFKRNQPLVRLIKASITNPY